MSPAHWNEEDALVGLFGLVLGAALCWLLRSGRRRRAQLPASIEDRIDHVVGTLNERHGKDWGHAHVGALQADLRRVLPAPLLPLLEVVHHVEEHAVQRGLSSTTKRWWAARVRRAVLA